MTPSPIVQDMPPIVADHYLAGNNLALSLPPEWARAIDFVGLPL
jgi:hypothetical protein